MKRALLVVGILVVVLSVAMVLLVDGAQAIQGEPEGPLTGRYVGTVVLTDPVGLDPLDMILVLTDTGGILSGYIDARQTLAYPVVEVTPLERGPMVSGSWSGVAFMLESEVFANPQPTIVAGAAVTISRQVLLHTAVISDTGEFGQLLTGLYRETLWGLAPQPVAMEGKFRLMRPLRGPYTRIYLPLVLKNL